MTRDTFINGFSSAKIRQHLLENDNLNLVEVYELADFLGRAQCQSVPIAQHTSQAAAITLTESRRSAESETTTQRSDRLIEQSPAITAERLP